MELRSNIHPHRPVVLTIAGLDPSGCAGLLADVKTFEAHGVYGMTVCTANTVQNVTAFKKPHWVSSTVITAQLKLLLQERNFDFVKIGLIESFELLQKIIGLLVKANPAVKIIWDPVCKASAQFVFHSNIQQKQLQRICSQIYLITPNLEELNVLTPGRSLEEAGSYMAQYCNVLVKGGHAGGKKSTDILFTNDQVLYLEEKRLDGFDKRGTGCVLSSAITANLAKGEELKRACAQGKQYIRHYLTSNHSMVGTHHYAN